METKQIKTTAGYVLGILAVSMIMVFGYSMISSAEDSQGDLELEKLTLQSLEIAEGLKTAKENAELWNNKVAELQKAKEENRIAIDQKINSGLKAVVQPTPVFKKSENQ